MLLAGGWGNPYASYYRAVLYDPSTGSWSPTGNLNIPRGAGHKATLLQDGRVLVAGGSSDADFATALHGAEIYDPNVGTWSLVAALHIPRAWEPATLLTNGRVLVAGGNVAEVFDPSAGNWTVTEPLIAAGAGGNTATLLNDGNVLVVGGYRLDSNYQPVPVKGADLYNPLRGASRSTANLNSSRFGHTATRLVNGSVLGRRRCGCRRHCGHGGDFRSHRTGSLSGR